LRVDLGWGGVSWKRGIYDTLGKFGTSEKTWLEGYGVNILVKYIVGLE
jgi:hypothetical protein